MNTVKITAADFNGTSFDGSPFSAWPEWLQTAVNNGVVQAVNPRCTDYAEWAVKTPQGVIVLSPGDMLNADLSYEISKENQYEFDELQEIYRKQTRI